MSNLRQAAQQALEALEHLHRTGDTQVFDLCYAPEVIPALRAALAEPEYPQGQASTDVGVPVYVVKKAEPVAWWNGRETVWFEHELMGTNPPIENPIPLYTTPTPRKPLSEDEIETINRDLPLLHMQARKGSVAVVFARAIEAAHGIKENA